MDTRTIEQTVAFQMSCVEVYETLMTPARHAALSGEQAIIHPEPGGAFAVWGSHLSGFTLALKRPGKIVQAWRASNWPEDHFSVVTFDLRETEGGCTLRFTQIGVPADQYASINDGWVAFYWTPMRELQQHGRLSAETQRRIQEARAFIQAGG